MALRQTDLHGHASAAPSERPPAPTQESVGAASLPEHLGYIVRFGLVGGTGVLVNSAVLFALVEGLHWHTLVAATVATETAIVSNFVLNDRWTFRQAENRTGWLGRLWRYNI